MRRIGLLVAVVGGLLGFSLPAYAHVTVDAPGASPGGFGVLAFRVPTESDTASTVELTVTFPVKTPLAFVSVQPVPGWTVSVTRTKLAKPISSDDGEVTEAVSSITWKAGSGAGIKPGEFQQFPVSVGPFPKGVDSLPFPTTQVYSDGKKVEWNQTAAPGSDSEPEFPAPAVSLGSSGEPAPSSAPSVSSSAAPTAASSADDSDSTTGPLVLSIVALVLAAAALGLGVVNRARRGTSA